MRRPFAGCRADHAAITESLLIHNRPNSGSSRQSPHSSHVCIIRGATLQTINSFIYDQHTPSHRRKRAPMCASAALVDVLWRKRRKKKIHKTPIECLQRDGLFIGLLQRGRRLFPHVSDQHFTRVRGGGEEDEGDSIYTTLKLTQSVSASSI